MAVYLGEDRPTSAGPLDATNNAGGDNVGLLPHDSDTSNNDLLDPDEEHQRLMGTPSSHGDLLDPDEEHTPKSEEDILREKNPLGYTITAPTREEIGTSG